MQNDAKTIHTAVTKLSYAFSKIHIMAGSIRTAAAEAATKNNFGKFKQCKKKMEDIANRFDSIGVSVSQIGQKLQSLENYVLQLEGE